MFWSKIQKTVRGRWLQAGLLSAYCLIFSACVPLKPVAFPVLDIKGQPLKLLAKDSDSQSGQILKVDRPLTYHLDAALNLSQVSLELNYELADKSRLAGWNLCFRADGENVWVLPGPDNLPEGLGADGVFRLCYRFPLLAAELSAFTIGFEVLSDAALAAKPREVAGQPLFNLKAVRLVERQFGYDFSSQPVWVTPFVYREIQPQGFRLVIDPPVQYRVEALFGVELSAGTSRATLQVADQLFTFLDSGPRPAVNHTIGAGLLEAEIFPLVYESTADCQRLIVKRFGLPAWPEPISLDPGLIQVYQRKAWRDPRFEVFRWPAFPEILIFDSADYAVQDRLFKRLAFFVEKAGYIGQLMKDEEIAHLHGWNAHDYQAVDLAAFFSTAKTTGFSLSSEELELRNILLTEGLIVPSPTGYAAGYGAVIALSQESAAYLRAMFMTHEAYHGIFFTNPAFRSFAAERWDKLPAQAKSFLTAYFDQNRYDTSNPYLMVNEFMAYCLQQPVSSAAQYFGENLPARLEKDPRRAGLISPRDPVSGVWPELAAIFEAEAAAFQAYVNHNWGLRAGSVSSVYQSSITNDRR